MIPGAVDAATTMVRTEGVISLYKGLAPTLVGIAPHAISPSKPMLILCL
jgi:hypothetical protein